MFFISCKSDKNYNCSFSILKLERAYDTSMYKKIFYSKKGGCYVFDNFGDTSDRGVFKFDDNGRIVSYAYIVNANNDANFGVEYNRNGEEVVLHGGEVVRWMYRDIGKDSTRVTFFLYALSRQYKNLKIYDIKNRVTQIDKLHTSPIFLYLEAGRFTFSKNEYDSIKFVLVGDRKNICTQAIFHFTDSLIISKEKL